MRRENNEKREEHPSHIASPVENPFTPTFGEIPLFMAGRNDFLSRMSRAFDRKDRAAELTTLISEARGTGKTSLIGYVAELAERHGWISVSVTALPGLLDEVHAIACRKIRRRWVRSMVCDWVVLVECLTLSGSCHLKVLRPGARTWKTPLTSLRTRTWVC